MHGHGLRALNEDWRPAQATEEAFELVVGNPAQDRWVGDFVAVEVQDRQHRPIAGRVDEFVDVPARRERTGFGFPVAHAGNGDQFRVVENGAAGVGEHIAELTAFMDRAGGFGRAMAADMPGEREHFEELAQPFFVHRLVGVALAVAAIDIDRTTHAWCAVAWA